MKFLEIENFLVKSGDDGAETEDKSIMNWHRQEIVTRHFRFEDTCHILLLI